MDDQLASEQVHQRTEQPTNQPTNQLTNQPTAQLVQLRLWDRLPTILDALADRAEEGHVGAARLILEALEDRREPSVTQVVNLASLTAADFAAILRESEVWQALIREADRRAP